MSDKKYFCGVSDFMTLENLDNCSIVQWKSITESQFYIVLQVLLKWKKANFTLFETISLRSLLKVSVWQNMTKVYNQGREFECGWLEILLQNTIIDVVLSIVHFTVIAMCEFVILSFWIFRLNCKLVGWECCIFDTLAFWTFCLNFGLADWECCKFGLLAFWTFCKVCKLADWEWNKFGIQRVGTICQFCSLVVWTFCKIFIQAI